MVFLYVISLIEEEVAAGSQLPTTRRSRPLWASYLYLFCFYALIGKNNFKKILKNLTSLIILFRFTDDWWILVLREELLYWRSSSRLLSRYEVVKLYTCSTLGHYTISLYSCPQECDASKVKLLWESVFAYFCGDSGGLRSNNCIVMPQKLYRAAQLFTCKFFDFPIY